MSDKDSVDHRTLLEEFLTIAGDLSALELPGGGLFQVVIRLQLKQLRYNTAVVSMLAQVAAKEAVAPSDVRFALGELSSMLEDISAAVDSINSFSKEIEADGD